MKRVLGYVVFLFLSFLSLSLIGQSNNIKLDYKCKDGYLGFKFHIPKSKENSEKSIPLVIVMHGCSQSAESISIQSGWNKLADTYNFYVLYPQQKLYKNPSNCFNWFLSDNIKKDKGELYCIKQAVDFVISKYNIDTSSIFTYGVSAGAIMSMALMSCYPQLINAGACLAGLPYYYSDSLNSKLQGFNNLEKFSSEDLESFIRSQNPNYYGKYPKIIIVQGKKDLVVPMINSYTMIRQWTKIHKLQEEDLLVENDFEQCKGLKRKVYFDKDKNSKIVFYEMEFLGHAIMVNPGEGEKQGGVTGVFSVDKGFFSTYWIAKDFGLIHE